MSEQQVYLICLRLLGLANDNHDMKMVECRMSQTAIKEGDRKMNKLAWVRTNAVVVLGALIVSGCCTSMWKEKKVSLDQVPAVTKAAIEKETVGGTIKEIEKEQCCGKAAYEVEYVKDGRKIEVKFAEDGTIMTCCRHGDKCQKCGK